MRIRYPNIVGTGLIVLLLSSLAPAIRPTPAAASPDPTLEQPVVAAAKSTTRTPAETQVQSTKPAGPPTSAKLLVWFTLDETTSSTGSTVTANLNVDPGVNVASFDVQLAATGNLSLTGSSKLTLEGTTARTPVAAPVIYTVKNDGEGKVRAVVTAKDARGKVLDKSSAELDVLAVDSEALHSNVGITALKLQSLEERHKAGKITDEEHSKGLHDLWRRGPKPQRVQTSPRTVSIASANVSISGNLKWTDYKGGTHPLPYVTVAIMDDDGVGDDEIMTTTTDAQGHYAASFPNDTGLFENGYDLYVKILSQGEGAWVEVPLNDINGVYKIEGPPTNDVPDGSSWTWDYTVGKTDHIDRAFGVYASVATAHEYMKKTRSDWSESVEVNYPTPYAGTSYQWLTNNLEIGAGDWSDWDVIQHEYGHFVADVLGFDDTTCVAVGDQCVHTGYQNMSQVYGDKSRGTAMAWAEGWPTYFALTVQREMNVSTTVPDANDTWYDDANYETNVVAHDSVESDSTGASTGEDQEMAIMRILWDLYDNVSDSGDSNVSFDDGYLMELFRANDSNRLSEAYQRLIDDGLSLSTQLNIGGIFTQHKVAPDPKTTATWAEEATSPSFSWDPGGGGSYLPNDQFVVQFYNDALTSVLYESSPIYGTSWAGPSNATWASIWTNSGSNIKWAVKGTQTDDPQTGPYLSRVQTIPKNTVTGMTVSPKTATITNVGLGQKLTANANYKSGSTSDVSPLTTWSSDDQTVATVSNTGFVTAVSTGSTTIRATYKGYSDTATINVTCPTQGGDFNCAIVITGTSASGSVAAGGNVYYKVKVNAGQAYKASMTMTARDADLFVHNPAKLKIGFSENPAAYAEQVTFVPTVTGYYYLRVYGYEGPTNFTLSITTTTCTAGVSLDCPINVSVGGSASGSVAGRSSTFFRFYGNAGMQYTITSKPSSGDPDIFMYDSYLNENGKSELGSSLHDQVVITAPNTGYQFIEIYGFDPGSFVVSVASGNTGCATGFDMNCAVLLSGSTSHYIDQGWTISYKFYVTQGTSYTVTLAPSSGDPDLYVYDTNQALIGQSTAGTGATDRVTFTASASGYYYARVYGYSTARFTLSR